MFKISMFLVSQKVQNEGPQGWAVCVHVRLRWAYKRAELITLFDRKGGHKDEFGTRCCRITMFNFNNMCESVPLLKDLNVFSLRFKLFIPAMDIFDIQPTTTSTTTTTTTTTTTPPPTTTTRPTQTETTPGRKKVISHANIHTYGILAIGACSVMAYIAL